MTRPISLKPPKVSLKPPTYPPMTQSTLFPAEPANPFRQTKRINVRDLTREELERLLSLVAPEEDSPDAT